MDVKWWWILAVGALCLACGAAAAAVVPMPRIQRLLRPLAHVERLTQLPEYARVYRVYFISMMVTGVLLIATFTVAVVATARPVGSTSGTKEFDAAFPEDVMLCVGEDVSDPTTAAFLNYFEAQMDSLNSERIGLTSATLRVIPLTRDHDYVGQRLEYFAQLARIQQDLDIGHEISADDEHLLTKGVEDFSRSPDYADYTRSVEDVLALCMTGFPSFDGRSDRRRSVIYVGPATMPGPHESLFTTKEVVEMAADAGVQINVIARSDLGDGDGQETGSVRTIAAETGGEMYQYNPAGTGVADEGEASTLSGHLDDIRANPPKVVLDGGQSLTRRTWDTPDPVLLAALAVVSVLCVSLAVLRR